jgi:hypothetical protein
MSYPSFDYATISDVIFHIRYTARQGVVAAKVTDALNDLFQQASLSNLALLFSLRYDFPTEWSALANGVGDFTATIRRDYFPYFTHGKTITINGIELYSQDVTKHHVVGDPVAATNDLGEKTQFTLSIGPDAAGQNQVLTHAMSTQVFMIIRYSFAS